MKLEIHPDLLAAQTVAYKPMGLICNNLVSKAESQDYGACSFEINNKIIEFRVAKITPTKIGQFVTFWKRIGNGPIMPYDMSDSFNLLIVSVRNAHHFGQFIFPKNILWQKNCYRRIAMVASELCAFILHGMSSITRKRKKLKLGNFYILQKFNRVLMLQKLSGCSS